MTTLSRRSFMAQSAGALALSAGANTARAQSQPNVILVMTDDQGYGDIAKHGNRDLPTPNLDKLHGESVRLTNFHVSPTCSPTRAALMTGRYNNRTGVWHTIMGRSILRRDEITMADSLGDAGYRTAIFGKWHLGDAYPYRPEDRGFQETLVHGGGGVGQMPDHWGNDYIDDTYFRNGTPEKFDGYCTDIWFDGAMDFIESSKDKPFFCYLSTNAPHSPYIAPEKWIKPFLDKGIEEPRAQFYGMIANIDWNMGRLTDHLERLGIADNTILIFMTDNGTAAGMHGEHGFNGDMRGKKGSEYDGGHRVPCFLRWPQGKLAHGRDAGRLTAHIDLFPTLLDLCGVDNAPHGEFDGKSIAPLLRDPRADWPDRTIVTDSQRIEHPQQWRKSCVMWHSYRLVNGKELYDLAKDPGQQHDIAADRVQITARLRAEYNRWWASTSERFDEYCPMVLGHPDAPLTRLVSHDWHGERVPWHQRHILSGDPGNGFWAIDVARPGKYNFELRRWPRELDLAMDAAPKGATALPITAARIRVGTQEQETPIEPGAHFAQFTLDLPAGETRLQTFLDCDDHDRGAYYVYCSAG